MSVGNNFKTSYVEFLQWSSMPYTAAGVYTCRATSLQNSSEEKALEFKVLGTVIRPLSEVWNHKILLFRRLDADHHSTIERTECYVGGAWTVLSVDLPVRRWSHSQS
jgi:hypothetical protein